MPTAGTVGLRALIAHNRGLVLIVTSVLILQPLGLKAEPREEEPSQVAQEQLPDTLADLHQDLLEKEVPEVIAQKLMAQLNADCTPAQLEDAVAASANFRLRDQVKMGLVTVDTYRIAAARQLRSYAEIFDLPMKVVTNPRSQIHRPSQPLPRGTSRLPCFPSHPPSRPPIDQPNPETAPHAALSI